MVNNEKYDWVNALRGYAILLVILIHSSQTFSVFGPLKTICSIGYLGVQLFFILSSFTLFNSYSKRVNIDSKNTNRNFFVRRFFRIAPYYYIAGLIYITYRILIKNEIINVKNLISNYTFTNGIYLPGINDIPPGGWSIGIEMLFYLFIPVLFKFIDSLFKAVLFFIISVIGSILINHIFLIETKSLINSIWFDIKDWTYYLWLPNQMPIFGLGIILYFINKYILVSFKAGKILINLSLFLFFVLSFYNFSLEYPYYFLKKEYVYGVIYVCLAIGLYSTNNKLIINNLIQKVGLVSFSMYLNHFFILYVLGYLYGITIKFMVVYIHLPEVALRNNFVFFISYLFVIYLTFFVSRYSYKIIELKGIEFGNKLINMCSK